MQANILSFWRNFIRDPRATGAVAPATRSLASSVARAANAAHSRQTELTPGADRRLKVVELGAGTGALTQQIRALNPLVIERDKAWAAMLQVRFPALEVRQGCAMEVLRNLREPVGVISSIPLLNNPQSAQLKAALDDCYRGGLLKFCVLYTYGWTNPLSGGTFRDARRASFVTRSLPPAHVWVYE